MLFIILCVSICIYVFYLIFTDVFAGLWVHLIFAILFSIVWLAIALLINCVITSFFIYLFNVPYKFVDSIPVYALSNHIGSSGSFFLGIGSIEDETTYFYLIKNSNGYQIKRLENGTGVYIKEDAKKKTARVDFYDPINRRLFFWLGDFTPLSKAIIHIPKGSIKLNFKVNI
jgi:hypothetical protein